MSSSNRQTYAQDPDPLAREPSTPRPRRMPMRPPTGTARHRRSRDPARPSRAGRSMQHAWSRGSCGASARGCWHRLPLPGCCQCGVDRGSGIRREDPPAQRSVTSDDRQEQDLLGTRMGRPFFLSGLRARVSRCDGNPVDPDCGPGWRVSNLSKTRAIAEANVKTDKTVGCQMFRAGEQQPAVDPDRGCSYCTAAERWAIPAPRGYHLPAVAMRRPSDPAVCVRSRGMRSLRPKPVRGRGPSVA